MNNDDRQDLFDGDEKGRAYGDDFVAREEQRRSGGDGAAQKTAGRGGWLAAVIALSAVCLVLATIVTYGWFNISAMRTRMESMRDRSLYELNAIVDDLDSTLAKARVASSPRERAVLMTDVAIESEMAEMILERMPADVRSTGNIAAFMNKMGDSAQAMIATAAAGGEIEEWQRSSLEYMYVTNARLKKHVNEAISSGQWLDDDVLGDDFSRLGDALDIKNNIIEEPKGIFDGPFSDGAADTNLSVFEGQREISESEAENIASDIFADYGVSSARCTGRTEAGELAFYNVELDGKNGEMLAQISVRGGKLVMFDSYKECTEHNFTPERCIDIAEQFLKKAGYEGLVPVWVNHSGTTCHINFCHMQDGVVVYPDMIKLKVCEERGIVTGAEAFGYVKNHSHRDIGGATLTKEEALSAVDGRLEARGGRLVLIPLNGYEVLCYEFFGRLDGREYFAYVDAATGEEVQVLTVVGTAQGREVM